MRIIFAGTPEIAVPVLKALSQTNHEIVALFTQPDKPAGRGLQLTPPPTKLLAMELGIPIHQPKSLRNAEATHLISQLKPDLMVVIAYGLIIPQTILDIPTFGCINLHVSLLPRWRGAAPIQRALLAGDTATGVTLMQMDAGLDTGDILATAPCSIDMKETSQSLHDKLASLSAELLINNLDSLATQSLTRIIQDHAQHTYAPKIDKAEADIHWEKSAIEIERAVRAFNPWPIAYSHINGERLRIWKADVIEEQTNKLPGTIIAFTKHGIDVACGENVLRITELQWPGGKRQAVSLFIHSNQTYFKLGDCFTRLT